MNTVCDVNIQFSQYALSKMHSSNYITSGGFLSLLSNQKLETNCSTNQITSCKLLSYSDTVSW